MNYFVSLGSSCDVADVLRFQANRLGSMPFDRIICSLSSVADLLRTDFEYIFYEELFECSPNPLFEIDSPVSLDNCPYFLTHLFYGLRLPCENKYSCQDKIAQVLSGIKKKYRHLALDCSAKFTRKPDASTLVYCRPQDILECSVPACTVNEELKILTSLCGLLERLYPSLLFQIVYLVPVDVEDSPQAKYSLSLPDFLKQQTGDGDGQDSLPHNLKVIPFCSESFGWKSVIEGLAYVNSSFDADKHLFHRSLSYLQSLLTDKPSDLNGDIAFINELSLTVKSVESWHMFFLDDEKVSSLLFDAYLFLGRYDDVLYRFTDGFLEKLGSRDLTSKVKSYLSLMSEKFPQSHENRDIAQGLGVHSRLFLSDSRASFLLEQYKKLEEQVARGEALLQENISESRAISQKVTDLMEENALLVEQISGFTSDVEALVDYIGLQENIIKELSDALDKQSEIIMLSRFQGLRP